MSESVNPALIDLAKWAIRSGSQKQAFVPPGGGDPAAAGGAPPMDPAAMGGAPPGAPPGDSGAMMPPPEQSMAPPPQPVTPESIMQMVTQAVQQAMAGGGAGGKGGKGAKANMELMAQDVFQTKRLVLHMFSALNLSIPPDVLDDPNRDPTTGMLGGGQPQAGPVPVQPGAAAPPTAPGIPPAGAPAGGEKMGSEIEPIGSLVVPSLADHSIETQASAIATVARRLAKSKKGA